ncbi:MAG: ABC transporter ATP-binding protein [Promethearchaeota archaeon]
MRKIKGGDVNISTILKFENITKKFGKKIVLDNINLNIRENELFGLIGSSGAGKTVLLKTITGFYVPDAGTIIYKSTKLHGRMGWRKLVGFSTQHHHFYLNLTPVENLKYFGTLYNLSEKDIKDRTKRLLHLVELWKSKDVISRNLSGGMQRRLDLACALIHKPKILLLDEPTSGLDPILRNLVLALIQKINKFGTTVIIASHFIDEIEPICSRVAIIDDGRILTIGKPFDIRDQFSKVYEIRLRSFPGRYKQIVKTLVKNKFDIVSHYIKNQELIFYVSRRYMPASYLKSIHANLIVLNEKLIQFSIDRSPFRKVFEAIVKNVDKENL